MWFFKWPLQLWVLRPLQSGKPMLRSKFLCCAFSCSLMQVLVDELADPKFRGSILCIIMTCASGGIFVIGTLAALLDWRAVSGVATAVSLLSVFPFFFILESPSWLVRKNRVDEAARGLAWLWGPGRETEVSKLHVKHRRDWLICGTFYVTQMKNTYTEL
jgi:MFS family permease